MSRVGEIVGSTLVDIWDGATEGDDVGGSPPISSITRAIVELVSQHTVKR